MRSDNVRPVISAKPTLLSNGIDSLPSGAKIQHRRHYVMVRALVRRPIPDIVRCLKTNLRPSRRIYDRHKDPFLVVPSENAVCCMTQARKLVPKRDGPINSLEAPVGRNPVDHPPPEETTA